MSGGSGVSGVGGVTIRQATEGDVEAILDVFAAVVDEGIWMGTEAPFDREERAQRFRDSIQSARAMFLVAEALETDDEPAIVGHLFLNVAPYGVAQIGMCVLADWRGKRVGSALVAESVEQATRLGAHKMSLELWPHNEAARRLYEGYGFVAEGRLRRHYRRRNGELWDSVVMGRVLDEDTPGSPYGG